MLKDSQRICVLSTIDPEEDWIAPDKETTSECDIVVIGKGTSAQEQENDHRWGLLSGDPKTIAISTLLLMRICINSGLKMVKRNHELQHGRLTKVFTRSAGRPKKVGRGTFFKNTDYYRSYSQRGISHEEREFKIDTCASMHLMRSGDLVHEESETIRKSKESCTLLPASGSITSTEEASVNVRDLDMFIVVQLLEDSLPCALARKVLLER